MEAVELALDHSSHVSTERWTNHDNKEFCEKLSLHGFLDLLRISGLTNNPDVSLITDYINSANSILEIGGGYGRVVNACRQIGYTKKLTTIEYAHSHASFMKDHIGNCQVIEGDFLTQAFDEKFDLILMMWLTIATFNPSEQKLCLKKCARLLKNEGYCIIDLLISNASMEATARKPKEYCLHDQETGLDQHGYVPTTFEIIRAAAMAGLAVRQVKEYVAGTAARCLVILGKS
jgi:SAM-dependent methyltransferase